MPDHAVQNQGVGPAKTPVLETIFIGNGGRPARDGVVLFSIAGKNLRQVTKLNGLIHVQAWQFTLGLPDRFGQGARVRQWRIIMNWRNVDSLFLPGLKGPALVLPIQDGTSQYGNQVD